MKKIKNNCVQLKVWPSFFGTFGLVYHKSKFSGNDLLTFSRFCDQFQIELNFNRLKFKSLLNFIVVDKYFLQNYLCFQVFVTINLKKKKSVWPYGV